MSTAEILNAAADLIERTGWTQRANARNENGTEVATDDPHARCFCLYGAIRHIDTRDDGFHAERVVSDFLGVGSAIDWNDATCRSQPEVVQALRDAAKTASGV